jgi:hypothetical protein
MITYSTKGVEQLTVDEQGAILAINNQRSYPSDPLMARGYIFSHLDNLDYLLELVEERAAQVFLAKESEQIVGFLILICLDPDSKFVHRREVECALGYVAPFLRELKSVGVASYIDRIAVKAGIAPECGAKLARQALIWAQSSTRKIAVMAGIIHYQNYYSLNFFRALKFRIIDFYDTEPVFLDGKKVSAIWLRLVRILRPSDVSGANITNSNASILTKLRYAELADTICPAAGLGKRWIEKQTQSDGAQSSRGDDHQVLWQGRHVHGSVGTLHNAIPRAGFCDYRTIELLSDSIRRANSGVSDESRAIKAREAMDRVGVALSTILALYRAREAGKQKSITTYLHAKRAWFVLTNTATDHEKYHVHGCRSVILNLNDSDQENSHKVAAVFGGNDDCSSWLEAYRLCMAADLAVWELHSQSRGKSHGTTPVWIHVFGPTNWDNRLYAGTFATRIFAGRVQGADWANMLRDMFASATVMSDVILRLNAQILVHASRQSARAAIMSRNLSHNIGSHALANPELYAAVGIEGLEAQLLADGKCGECRDHAKKNSISLVKARLATFHQYTQTRLDFIARTLNPQVERPEPLFLLNDLLNGLFRQSVLLDTLLADRGFPMRSKTGGDPGAVKKGRGGFEREISFHLEVALGDQATHHTFTRSRDSDIATDGFVLASLGPQVPKGFADFLVGIPGGMIGCHALYSFIENLMRNSAKYGRHCGKEDRGLEIHLRLRHAKACDCDDSGAYYVL